jgi:hypothetical protein
MALSPEMQKCIDICLDCHKTCLGMAMNHCLETGGEHAAPAHFRLMMACAGALHADLVAPPQAYLPGMRGDLRRVREGVRAARWDGGMRRRLPRLRSIVQRDGRVSRT